MLPIETFVIEENLFPKLLVTYIKEHAYKENVIAPLKGVRNTRNKERRIFGMETYITNGQILFCRRHQTLLLDQLKYFPRDIHDDGPDALEMALQEATKRGVTFKPVNDDEIRDKYGRSIYDREFGWTRPEDDILEDEDD